jgi:hypothetical protein
LRRGAALNAFSEAVIETFGETDGQHARTAIGSAALPLNLPVGVAAKINLHPEAGRLLTCLRYLSQACPQRATWDTR